MNIIPLRLDEYMMGLLPERHQKFYEMEEYALQNKFPIVGPLSGNFLAQQALTIGAKRVLELGSGFGYSALWFSTVLSDDGKIICTDHSEENAQRAAEVFKELGKEQMLEYHIGNALDVFEKVDGEFDFIFGDIKKYDYPRTFDLAMPRLRRGGILAFDNALYSGRMVEGDESDATKGVVELNKKAFASPECYTSIVPVRDGILLCRKA